jgi:hypothetical protein
MTNKLVVTQRKGWARGLKLKEYLSWCPNCKQHTPDDIGACANCYKVKPVPAKLWDWKPKAVK